MCRMVGLVFRRQVPMDTLCDLRRVAEVGVVPEQKDRGHNDGWGIVSFTNDSPHYIGRSDRAMHNDPSFDAALMDAQKMPSPNILIAHARAASKGSAKMENTHPFVIGGLVLAHNGTVYDLEPPKGAIPKGESDSELLALILAERYAQEGDLERALTSLITEDIGRRKSSAAVLLVSDGRTLFGYRDFTSDDRASYYDLRIAKGDGHVALYQETVMGYTGESSQVSKGELVGVSLDLSVRRRMVA